MKGLVRLAHQVLDQLDGGVLLFESVEKNRAGKMRHAEVEDADIRLERIEFSRRLSGVGDADDRMAAAHQKLANKGDYFGLVIDDEDLSGGPWRCSYHLPEILSHRRAATASIVFGNRKLGLPKPRRCLLRRQQEELERVVKNGPARAAERDRRKRESLLRAPSVNREAAILSDPQLDNSRIGRFPAWAVLSQLDILEASVDFVGGGEY